jgi:ubiquilin
MMRQMLENPEMRRMLMDPALIRQSLRMQGMFGGGAQGGNTSSMPAPGVTDTTPQNSTGTTGSTPASGGSATGTNTQPPAANPLAAMLGGGVAGAGAGNAFASLFGAPPAAGVTGTDVSRSVGSPQGQQANPFAQLFGGGGAGGAGGMPNFSPEMMQQMMSAFGGGAGGAGAGAGGANPFGMGGFGGQRQPAAPADTRPPEEIYSEQLRQLNEMGFYEFDRNVRALRMAGGNVQGAIELLFSGNL